MTIFLPLDPSAPVPPQPAFLVSTCNVQSHLAKAIQAIMKAKRIVVICGAGISVQAGIPDFRSSEGLFQTLKRDNPREAMSSGKELFDASVFNSENKTSLFCQMIAQLSDLSETAQPTAFHHLLRALDDRGRLLRVYTQNIDAIEQKSGLSFGVPEYDGRGSKLYKARKKETTAPIASTSRLPSPPAETPRCIPLHGTLQSMHCQICTHSFPLPPYLPSLLAGTPPPCPECTSLETTRQLIGKRPRGIGRLRPSVVLYNEAHKDGEGVGAVVQKDLLGSAKAKGRGKHAGADLVLVVGTSLKVPGTKRIVREFAKAVRARDLGDASSGSGSGSGLVTPRRTPPIDDPITPKAIYLNLDFPVPTREWEGVFDAWIQGDAQTFAEMLHAEIEKEARAKASSEKKTKKDELPDLGRGIKPTKKRKAPLVVLPPSPPRTPPSPGEMSMDTTPKLYLRIPSRHQHHQHHHRHRRTYIVPEVYINTLPPHPRQLRQSSPSPSSPTPTPQTQTQASMDIDHSPSQSRSASPTPPTPITVALNKHTKAGRRAVRAAQNARRAERAALALNHALALAHSQSHSHSPLPQTPRLAFASPMYRFQPRSIALGRESYVRSGAYDAGDVDVDIEMEDP